MKVVKLENLEKKKIREDSLFTGEVESQTPFPDSKSDLSVNYVSFKSGVHNKFHTHSNDQILIVTDGQGFVETNDARAPVEVGDVIHIPAGEVHRHGAILGNEFTHISVTRSETKLEQVEE